MEVYTNMMASFLIVRIGVLFGDIFGKTILKFGIMQSLVSKFDIFKKNSDNDVTQTPS